LFINFLPKDGQMKKLLVILFMSSILFYAPSAFTGEHGGKEHGGKEHGGRKIKAQPTGW
jgi:hypothetical protein